MSDLYDLDRFVRAQNLGATYEHAVEQLLDGNKTSHWMWFVFPQIAGLGTSPTSRRYAIASLEEAKAYLAHPLLGPRLRECSSILLTIDGRSAGEIFGAVDARKLQSCMTLFVRANPDCPVFQQVLDHYFDAQFDPATEAHL